MGRKWPTQVRRPAPRSTRPSLAAQTGATQGNPSSLSTTTCKTRPMRTSLSARSTHTPSTHTYRARAHRAVDARECGLSSGSLARRYSKIEAFAKEMGVDFYPAGRGIGHQASAVANHSEALARRGCKLALAGDGGGGIRLSWHRRRARTACAQACARAAEWGCVHARFPAAGNALMCSPHRAALLSSRRTRTRTCTVESGASALL